jgi:hypothetical protein
MSKRTRYADNSKRQQPIQQQRAQARLPTNQGATQAADAADSQPRAGRETGRRGKERG